MLSRLVAKRQQQREFSAGQSMQLLERESNLRRNHLVLEEVVRQRERTAWLDSTATLINAQKHHHQQQQQQSCKTLCSDATPGASNSIK